MGKEIGSAAFFSLNVMSLCSLVLVVLPLLSPCAVESMIQSPGPAPANGEKDTILSHRQLASWRRAMICCTR
jgi:hypothetical protein